MADKTVWEVIHPDDGKTNVNIGAHHGDNHDEWLTLTGNFENINQKLERAQEICDQLNGGKIDASELFKTKNSLLKLIESYCKKHSGGSIEETLSNNKTIHILTALKLEITDSITPEKIEYD